MATKALQDLGKALIKRYLVAAANTLKVGSIVYLSAEGTVALSTAATAEHLGIVTGITDGGATATAGDEVSVVHLGTSGVAKVLVGTSGATAGAHLTAEADGATDATTGGGTAQCNTIGLCLQTGVAGDFVGVAISLASASVSA